MRGTAIFQLLIVAVIALFACAGCGPDVAEPPRPSPSDPAAPTPGGQPTAASIWAALRATYAKAPAYQANTEIRLAYRFDERLIEQRVEVLTQFRRGQHLRLEVEPKKDDPSAFRLILAADPQRLRARVVHPETGDFHGQLVEQKLREPISIPLLHLATQYMDPEAPQQFISLLDGAPLRLDELPVALLLSPDALAHLSDAPKALLPEKSLSGRACRRLRIETEEGEHLLWIAADSGLLLRWEYPTKPLEEQLRVESGNRPIEDLTLTADFGEAAFDSTTEDPMILADGPVQRHFILPPPPLPTSRLGSTPSKWELPRISGQSLSGEQLRGKVTALLWFASDPDSRMAAQQLQLCAKQMRTNSRVAFFGVCVEPGAVKPGEIGAMLRNWRVDLPILRDTSTVGRDHFGVEEVPTLVLLDAHGKLQLLESGPNPRLHEQLPVIFDRVLAGKDVAQEILTRHADHQSRFEHLLAEARNEQPKTAPVSATNLPAASEPFDLKLKPLWTCDKIERPGNLLVLPGEPPRLLVCDGWRALAVLGLDGEVLERIAPPLPEQAAMACLSRFDDNLGRSYIVASARLGRQAYVLSDRWELLLAYPAADREHDGVQDARLSDLNGDGVPELLTGFWGADGIEAATLDGKRLWQNRTATPILSIARGPNLVSTLVTSNRGLILPLGSNGGHQEALRVAGHAIHHLHEAEFANPVKSRYLGLCYTGEDRLQAVALNARVEKVWDYQLPEGVFRNPIQSVASARLLDSAAGQWLIAGADGSIHLISDDGTFSDYFHTGRELTGLTGVMHRGRGILVAASREGVIAWEVRGPTEPRMTARPE